MPSERKHQSTKVWSNRANAAASTGPRSAGGKAAVSANAVRHGLFAKNPVLPEEDEAAFEELCAGLIQELGAETVLERELAWRAASSLWRLKRLARLEAELLTPRAPLPGMEKNSAAENLRRLDLPRLARYESTLERSLYRALGALAHLKGTGEGRDKSLPPAGLGT